MVVADCCFLITRYDHLSEVLSKILDERPNHCVGKLVKIKASKGRMHLSTLFLAKLDVLNMKNILICSISLF